MFCRQFFPTHPSPTPLTERVVNICYVQELCIRVFFVFFFKYSFNLAVICLNCIWFILIFYLFYFSFSPPSLFFVVVVLELNLTSSKKSKLHWKICSELLIPHLFLPIFSFLSFESYFFLFLIHACCFFLQK